MAEAHGNENGLFQRFFICLRTLENRGKQLVRVSPSPPLTLINSLFSYRICDGALLSPSGYPTISLDYERLCGIRTPEKCR